MTEKLSQQNSKYDSRIAADEFFVALRKTRLVLLKKQRSLKLKKERQKHFGQVSTTGKCCNYD